MGPIMGGIALHRYTTTNSVVMLSGTSLVAYMPTTTLNTLAPISSQFTSINWGVNGQSIGGARTNAASKEDASFDPAKKNVLIFWGATNSIWYFTTGVGAYNEVATYVAERKAAHPTVKIILTTEIPRYEGTDTAVILSKNAEIEAYNALLRANWRAIGADGLADLRAPGSLFNLPDYTLSTFQTGASAALWDTTAAADYKVHLSPAGYSTAVFPVLTAALKRIRR